MAKDWTGGRASVFKTIGASSHADHERQREDYYATEPAAAECLCKLETFKGPILEPACGEGHISKALIGGGIPLRRGISWIEVMVKWLISSLLITPNGMAISSPTLRTNTHWSLWRKPWPSFQKDEK